MVVMVAAISNINRVEVAMLEHQMRLVKKHEEKINKKGKVQLQRQV